jgi:hypothetical protein
VVIKRIDRVQGDAEREDRDSVVAGRAGQGGDALHVALLVVAIWSVGQVPIEARG